MSDLKNVIWLVGLGVLAPLAFVLLQPATVDGAVPWTEKVDPWVLDRLDAQGEAEFLVFLREQADVSGAAELTTKAERGKYVFERLTAAAARSQSPVLEELAARGLEHRGYWVANMIWVRGDEAAVAALAARDDVRRIYGNPSLRRVTPLVEEETTEAPQGVEQSLVHVGAPDFWAAGFTGQGTVVAGADTGYHWEHPALKNQYRGWDGAKADHNYNWHDAIHIRSPTAAPIRRSPATTAVTARTPWARWWATTAAATRSAWRRGRAGSAAAT